MKITIINSERNEKRYTRESLDDYVAQLREGTYRQYYANNLKKEVCFAAEWVKTNGELRAKTINPLVLLSIENLRDLPTVEEYKRRAICRELLGSGSIFGLTLLPETYNILLFVLPPGAFIMLGFLIAIVNKIKWCY